MGRTLSLLGHSTRLEPDGLTHRRDCECARCDVGYRPTEHARAESRHRVIDGRAREQAARDVARRLERERLDQTNMRIFVNQQVDVANDQIRALREARKRGAGDPRLMRLWKLRRAGCTLRDAIGAIEASKAGEE